MKFAGDKIIGVQSISKEKVDTFLKNEPSTSLIRMEVEGHEYQILTGMPSGALAKPEILGASRSDLLH